MKYLTTYTLFEGVTKLFESQEDLDRYFPGAEDNIKDMTAYIQDDGFEVEVGAYTVGYNDKYLVVIIQRPEHEEYYNPFNPDDIKDELLEFISRMSDKYYVARYYDSTYEKIKCSGDIKWEVDINKIFGKNLGVNYLRLEFKVNLAKHFCRTIYVNESMAERRAERIEIRRRRIEQRERRKNEREIYKKELIVKHQEVLTTLKDISADIEDDGFVVEINLDTDLRYGNIIHVYVKGPKDYFKMSDIDPTLERMDSFMKSEGYSWASGNAEMVNFTIDNGINFNTKSVDIRFKKSV